jgi:hypothetical protein
MTHRVPEVDLMRIREWANARLTKGRDQPWSLFLLDRLVETIDALLAGEVATRDDKSKSTTPTLRLVNSSSPEVEQDKSVTPTSELNREH